MKNLVFTVGVFLLITAVKSKFIQQQRISYPDHLLVKMHNEILEEIREALQYASDNITIEEIIPKMFNLGNPNPTYKFILPGKQPRQVVMKKSDFQKPFFPKLTEAYVQLSRLTLKDFPIVRMDDTVSQEISYIDPKLNSTNSLYNNSPGDTIDELNALQKNLQTERNFIQYMEVLNERGESLSIILNRKDQNRNRQKDLIATDTMERKKYQLEIEDDVHIYNNGTSDWEQLGLTGWSGNISIPTDLLQKNNKSEKLRRLSSKFGHKSKFSNRNSKKIVEIERTVAGNFLPPLQLSFLDDPKSIEIWDLPGKISNKLVKLISEENEAYKNMTNLLNTRKKIHWPITNTRRLHKDVDVYIARANDPFGHSTKWRFRNSTDTINRNKRSVANLYSMIKCSTGCDPLIFKGYGCYCGFLGSGTPTDGIDRCCRRHDKCYEFSSCPSYLTYFVPYLWKCYRGRPLCAVNHGEWGGKGSCATRLCKCDLALSKCLRKFVCPRRRAVCRSSPVRMLQNVLMIV